MKKRIWIPIFCFLVLCSCGYLTPQEKDKNEDQNVIHCASAEGMVTEKSVTNNTPCQIRLIKQQENEETSCSLVIEIDTESSVLKKELDSNVVPRAFESSLFLGDVDGDTIEEILIHHNTGGVGGFGLWQTWVLKIENDEILTLFESFNEFDTGFESRFLDNYQLEVKNRFIDYTLVFDVKDSHKKHITNSQEKPDGNIYLDSFYVFEPKDVDDDGICEIICKQYTSIFLHADYTGIAHSVLKFNTDAQSFKVVDAWYEPYVEE